MGIGPLQNKLKLVLVAPSFLSIRKPWKAFLMMCFYLECNRSLNIDTSPIHRSSRAWLVPTLKYKGQACLTKKWTWFMWKQLSSVGNMILEPLYIVVSINSVWLSGRAAQQGGSGNNNNGNILVPQGFWLSHSE